MESDAAIELRQKLSAGRRTLAEYTGKKFYYGIKTGLNEAFVIDRGTRDRFVQQHPASGTMLRPFVQGTHLRPFYIEDSDQFLITLKSSGDYSWAWSDLRLVQAGQSPAVTPCPRSSIRSYFGYPAHLGQRPPVLLHCREYQCVSQVRPSHVPGRETRRRSRRTQRVGDAARGGSRRQPRRFPAPQRH